MKAKKALKKLYRKASSKSPSDSVLQLNKLRNNNPPSTANERKLSIDQNTRNELQELAEHVAISAVSELAKPLNPIISWLNDAPNAIHIPSRHTQAANSSGLAPPQSRQTLTNVTSIGRLPLKSPPCKRCPALQNGLCKCAAKKFQLTA